jgi:internalin A
MQKPKRLIVYWLLMVIAIGVLNGTFISWAMLGANPAWLVFLAGAAETLIGGELLWISTVAGLLGRNWLQGVLGGALIAVLWLAIIILAMRDHTSLTHETFWYFFAAPLILSGAAIPAMVMRFVFGWRLSTAAEQFVPRRNFGVSEIFVVMAMIASFLFLSNVPQIALELPNNSLLLGMGMMMLTASIANAIVILPMVYVSFRIRQRWKRWLAYFVLLTLISILTFSFFGPFQNSPGMTVEVCCSFLLPTIAGLKWMRWIGYRLQCYAPRHASIPMPNATSSTDETENIQDDPWEMRDRTRYRILATSVFGFSVLLSLGLLGITSLKRQEDLANLELHQTMKASGGAVSLTDRIVTELKFGPDIDDESFAASRPVVSVQKISLAHTKITDASLKRLSKFPRLSSLDLSHTSITDEGLIELQRLRSLSHLSCAYTQVSADRATQTANQLRCTSLDLSGLNITDDQCLNILKNYVSYFQNLVLRDNLLTDAAVQQLISSPRIQELDISGNKIDGSFLVGPVPPSLRSLVLEDVPITDVWLSTNANNLTIEKLVFSNTMLTEGAFLSGTPCNRLELGDGAITDKGLSKSAITFFNSLKLKSKNFDGSCFESWHPQISNLDMSDSGITDDQILFLANIPNLRVLNLANTKITDAALPQLAQMPIVYLNLSNTYVSFEGLRRTPFQTAGSIQVAVGQFTAEQIRELRRKWPVIVGNPKYELQ